MIKREMEKELINMSTQYPVVTLTGPRQSGKTTLARSVFPDYNYCNLELPDIRQLALNDPRALLSAFPIPVVFGEVQRVPELLSYLQVMADEAQRPGQIILTGSQQLNLHEAIAQSLAGRTALLTLLPLSIRELHKAGVSLSRDELIYKGFFPRLYKDNLEPTKAHQNYYQTYIERDLRQISNIRNLSLYEKFMHLLAGRVGQLLNLSSLSGDIGVSATTLGEWLSILEASFIIFRLKPYYENFGKRVVKSPKIYFTDPGLAAYLLGIHEPAQVSRDPLMGNLFENLVVVEALKTRLNQGFDSNLFFYRDSNGNEIDLLYKKGRELFPIEIKAAMTYNETMLRNMDYFHKVAKFSQGFLIYSGELEFSKDRLEVINYLNTYKVFKE